MKVDRLDLHLIRWKLLIVFVIAVIICVILIVGVCEDDLIRYISGILSYYSMLTKGFGVSVFLLCLLYYFVVIRKTEGIPEKSTIHFLGPFPELLIKEFSPIVSIFYISLVIFYHMVKGTFSNEFSLDQLIILGLFMAYLLYWSLMRVYKMIIGTFYTAPSVKIEAKRTEQKE